MGKIMEKIKSNWEALTLWFLPTPEVGQIVVDSLSGIIIPIVLIWAIKKYGPRVYKYFKARKSKVARRVFIATKNKKKAAEFEKLFSALGIRTCILSDADGYQEPEEDGTTLQENALIKARAAARFTGEWTLADDTGLFIRAINWEPGLLTARYGGPERSSEKNLAKMYGKLGGNTDRYAEFRCVLALVAPDGREWVFEGKVLGSILDEPRGESVAGWDKVFCPEGYDKSFAELGIEVKNTLSHRSRAMEKMAGSLKEILGAAV